MKKATEGTTKTERFFSGKGFYIAVAISLAAVGGAAWLGVNSAMNKLETAPPSLNYTPQTPTTPNQGLPAQNEQSNVPAAEPSSMAPSSQSPSSAGVVQGYIMPLNGEVTNPFSGDKMVKSKTLDEWVMHTGMDIGAAVSTPVKAMSGGTVTQVKNDALWGTCVTIEHDGGLESFYANLKSAVNVKEGQAVKMGDVIGAVGETCAVERAEDSHLHFGVRKSGQWVDPASIVKR